MPMIDTPMSPRQTLLYKLETTPPEVYRAFNTLISRGLVQNASVVKSEDVIQLSCKNLNITRVGFKPEWLDIAFAYEKAGWKKVEYVKKSVDDGRDLQCSSITFYTDMKTLSEPEPAAPSTLSSAQPTTDRTL